ncbi:MAG: eukaryotic-like serine/threonine-protein kinase [Acidobacteriota bacterium]|nr:eukaryotic-like serine/threonine-protein kinase [Acidobacteriota bacterium]
MESLPKTLGHYEILNPIGAGGMGEVYVARDPTLGRKVAIKMLPGRLAADRETLSRFTQEARSASALNHPNIVTIHEVGAEAGVPYIVMEHIEGYDLRSMVHDGPVPVRKALDIATQIADGLAAAHERGIVHRDLKPENIMFTRDGYAKILDFGLAKMMGPAPDGENTVQLEMPGTNPGTILGTVGYMSPEQARGRRLDFRSDQFALGAILYELVTGKCAFDGETAMDTLAAILHQEPAPLTKVNPRVPVQLSDIVQRLLAKHPDERYASTRDLARELRLLRDRVAAEESGFRRSEPIPAPRRTRIAIAGAVVLAAAIGGAVWFARERVTPAATQTANPVQSASVSKKYLAVLRFKDLTGDANGQLVVDGFAETLTARLAHYPSIQVMRPSATQTESNDMPKVARELGANVVLSGTMQREGQRFRVSYSLVDLASGNEKRDLVDGPVTDLFGIQDDVARSVAQSMSLGEPPVRLAALDPTISQSRYLEALGNLRRYDDRQSVDNAVAILEDISRSTSSASVEAALGRAYLYKYQLASENVWATKAADACKRALQNDPQNPDVRITLGDLNRQTGRFDEALAQYQRALDQHPTSVDAILGMAEAYNGSNADAEAAKWYARAIELQPNYWATYNKAGVFYVTNGRYQDAIAMFQRVVELVPDNLRGYNNLGASYQLAGQYEQALRTFSQSLQRRPTYEAYGNVGTSLYFLGRYAEAAAAYEKAVELAPNEYVIWQNLGEAYSRLPDGAARAKVAFQRAVDLGSAALQVNPRDPATHAALALCFAKLGEPDRARRSIETALRLDPAGLSTKYKAAKIAAMRNDPEQAMKLLRQAIEGGYSIPEAAHEPEFATLRERPDFRQLMHR